MPPPPQGGISGKTLEICELPQVHTQRSSSSLCAPLSARCYETSFQSPLGACTATDLGSLGSRRQRESLRGDRNHSLHPLKNTSGVVASEPFQTLAHTYQPCAKAPFLSLRHVPCKSTDPMELFGGRRETTRPRALRVVLNRGLMCPHAGTGVQVIREGDTDLFQPWPSPSAPFPCP